MIAKIFTNVQTRNSTHIHCQMQQQPIILTLKINNLTQSNLKSNYFSNSSLTSTSYPIWGGMADW